MGIRSKILQYLEKELLATTDPRDEENRREVIQYLAKSKGECSGLSTMWAYSRMSAADDVETFFNKTNQLLLKWDGERDFDKQEKEDVERLVADVLFYQRGQFMFIEDSTDLLQMSADSEGREFKSSYKSDQAFLSKDLLSQRLGEIIQPNAMIFLSFEAGEGGHRVAVSQDQNQQFYYYNSNNEEEIKFSNVNDLSDRAWNDNGRANLIKSGSWQSSNVSDFRIDQLFRELRVDVAQFSDGHYSKPNKFLLTAEENELFLQSKSSAVSSLINNDAVQRYFLSLDSKSQIGIIESATKNKEIFVKLLADDLLDASPYKRYATDPAIAVYLMSKESGVVESLVEKGLLSKEAPELLSDTKESLSNLSQTFGKACREGDFSKVKRLVKMGVDVKMGLYDLVRKDDPEILLFLFEEKKLDLYDKSNSIIMYADNKSCMKSLEFLVSRLDENRSEENKIILSEALYNVCIDSQVSVAKFLLENGADSNFLFKNKIKTTTLDLAVSYDCLEIVQELLLHQADVKKGTPLSYAKSCKMAEMLLEKGALTEAKPYRETRLIQACKEQDVEMVELLLKYQANPNACDGYKQSAMQNAKWGDPEKAKETQELLLKHGAYSEPTRKVAVTYCSKLKDLVRDRGENLIGR